MGSATTRAVPEFETCHTAASCRSGTKRRRTRLVTSSSSTTSSPSERPTRAPPGCDHRDTGRRESPPRATASAGRPRRGRPPGTEGTGRRGRRRRSWFRSSGISGRRRILLRFRLGGRRSPSARSIRPDTPGRVGRVSGSTRRRRNTTQPSPPVGCDGPETGGSAGGLPAGPVGCLSKNPDELARARRAARAGRLHPATATAPAPAAGRGDAPDRIARVRTAGVPPLAEGIRLLGRTFSPA